jgi:hypothetical protein
VEGFAALFKNWQVVHSLESYEPLIGRERIERILRKAQRIRNLHVVHISSTFYGGGVTDRHSARSKETIELRMDIAAGATIPPWRSGEPPARLGITSF